MNWGKGIVIFMIAFMIFIGSMVYYAFTQNADLIQENYYESELNYDTDKLSKQNYLALENKIEMNQIESGVQILFPNDLQNPTKGKIIFYRADEKKYDREFELTLNENNEQILAYENFIVGTYEVSIQWSDSQKSYIYQDIMRF